MKNDFAYIPCSFALLRAPLLPIKSYLDMTKRKTNKLENNHYQKFIAPLLNDPIVELALGYASRSLLDAIKNNTMTNDGKDLIKLMRYLTRMSTRPTPFGLFASVACVKFNEYTDIEVENHRTRFSRPDMAWMTKFIDTLESNPEIRIHLNVIANPGIQILPCRIFLKNIFRYKNTSTGDVSIKATKIVLSILEWTNSYMPYLKLKERLINLLGNSSERKIDILLDQLINNEIILTDLMPSHTSENMSNALLERWHNIPAAKNFSEFLYSIITELSQADNNKKNNLLTAYQTIHDKMDNIVGVNQSKYFNIQMDSKLQLKGKSINRKIGLKAAEAVEILLALCPFINGPPGLANHRQAFMSRYNEGRQVKLLELLDPDVGIGPLQDARDIKDVVKDDNCRQRAEILLQIASQYLQNRTLEFVLNEEVLKLLKLNQISDNIPKSLDINVFVSAKSNEEIDSGKFELIIGPNLGANQAGRGFGRFIYLLDENGANLINEIATKENELSGNCMSVELICKFDNLRLANVSLYPGVYDHRIDVGGFQQDEMLTNIPLNEIVVGVRNNRYYLHWPRTGQDIKIKNWHMVNMEQTSPVCRFLCEVSNDGITQFYNFSWGLAEKFPFLPRVKYKNIILRPAQWQINYVSHKTEFYYQSFQEGIACLNKWREKWHVPQYVYVTFGDNRLLLDLIDIDQAKDFLAEIKKITLNSSLIVQEVLPKIDENWLNGEKGSYFSELVIPLVKKQDMSKHSFEFKKINAIYNDKENFFMIPPGDDCIFVKFYCISTLQNEILTKFIGPFCEELVGQGLISHWFFIRYNNPSHHLRIRFFGNSLINKILPLVCGFANKLFKTHYLQYYEFATYDREVERYGGDDGLSVAEHLFCHDSQIALKLLTCIEANPHSLNNVIILSLNNMVNNFLPPQQKMEWISKTIYWQYKFGDEYRKIRQELRNLYSIYNQNSNNTLVDIFNNHNKNIAPIVQKLNVLGNQKKLSISVIDLLNSYCHMHFNRVIGIDAELENQILEFLARINKEFEKFPLLPQDGTKKNH